MKRTRKRKPSIFTVGVSWSQTITNAAGQPLYDRLRHVEQTASGRSIRRAISSALRKFFTDKPHRSERAAGHREILIHAKRRPSKPRHRRRT
ncbi:MAG TPA: hypothetical protein VHP80_01530 [Candidatus Acidoferrum sp.]|jgi:hypothetical protein|nr:hypothetical protein [Candidatus Acidoferrum sp.]